MSTFYYLFFSGLIVMIISLSGVLFSWEVLRKFLSRYLSLLIALSAGVFSVASLHLYEESVAKLSFGVGTFWLFVGGFFVWLLFRLIPHHHYSDDCKHRQLDVRRLFFSDSLHNIGDGLLFVSSFAVSVELGVITTIGVIIHEFVQEVSEFFVLKKAGFSTVKALGYNFLSSSTIFIGIIGGYFVFDLFDVLIGPIFAIAAGSFLVVVLFDLLPIVLRDAKSNRHRYLVWLFFLVGVVGMFSLNILLSDLHHHDHEGHDKHSEHNAVTSHEEHVH